MVIYIISAYNFKILANINIIARKINMKHSIKKDYIRRHTYKKNEQEALIYKAIVCNRILPLSKRLIAVKLLDDLPNDSRITRIRNRCLITGRSRGIVKKYKVSRITFRKLVHMGIIPGVRRATW